MLIVGTNKSKIIANLPSEFLLIDDGPLIDALTFPPDWRVTHLDLTVHSLNPLQGMNYRKAREFVAGLYAASPQGENTLTVRNGRRALAKLLNAHPPRLDKMRFDHSDAQQEAKGMIEDLLLSDTLKDFLCKPTNFHLDGVLLARLDRTIHTDFECLILANILMSSFKGPIVVPDFGFYGTAPHVSLIRQGRLIAGVNYLDEPKDEDLRKQVLLMEPKIASHCIADDAEILAQFAGLIRDPMREECDFNKFVRAAIA